MVDLLTIHKLLEHGALGHTRYVAELETVAITSLLDRLVPDVFADALAVYEATQNYA